jgi:ribonucleoside-diphosphate reductase alpha chain
MKDYDKNMNFDKINFPETSGHNFGKKATNEVIKKKYSARDEDNKPFETPEMLMGRVLSETVKPEVENSDDYLPQESKWYWNFRYLFHNRLFTPNSPTWFSVGTHKYGADIKNQQPSACFVLSIKDDMEEIFNTIRDAALIHK